ncbi:Cell cycle regulator of non-homologous end joining [Apodemus speciosus]|uniref:Cell cycle regulator of non-homologous end joining n=1 Tax=Apodemus speciosus TaxID=105296 RepID=A0ABQ0EUE6_APOSI
MQAPATETVYFMNEAEMVDVALGILTEGPETGKALGTASGGR